MMPVIPYQSDTGQHNIPVDIMMNVVKHKEQDTASVDIVNHHFYP